MRTPKRLSLMEHPHQPHLQLQTHHSTPLAFNHKQGSFLNKRTNLNQQQNIHNLQQQFGLVNLNENEVQMHFAHSLRQESPFNVVKWLETIDIWDEKYDYVTHDDHWLTSKWSADCTKCQAKSTTQKSNETYDLNDTFDLYRSALEESIAGTPHPRPKNFVHQNQILQPQVVNQSQLSQQQQQQQQQNLNQQQQQTSLSKIPKIPLRFPKPPLFKSS